MSPDSSDLYDNAGRGLATIYPDGYALTNKINSLGQVTNVADSSGYSVTNWFNNQGLRYEALNPAGIMSYLALDDEDRATNTFDANLVSITNTFDALGRVLTRSYPDGGTEKWLYSAAGLAAYTNQLGFGTTYTNDAAGRKIAEHNANAQVTKFSFGPAGDLLTLTDGKNQVTTWQYDRFGRLTNKLDQTSVSILQYQYDPNNRLTNRWSAEKGKTAYFYDPAGNLTSIQYPVSSNISFSYDSLNRLTNMVDGLGTTSYSWDSAGQLLSETGPWSDTAVSYTYTNRLRASLSVVSPRSAPRTQTYSYDLARRLSTTASPARTFTYNYQSPIFNLPSSISLPNGSSITNAFDPVARLLDTVLVSSGNVTLDAAVYGYNVGGQRTACTNAAGAFFHYSYDPIGQLKVSSSSVSGENRGYTYDNAWNLNYLTNGTGASSTFSVDSKNQLTSVPAGSCAYDANGNLTNDAAQVFIYDDENRLVQWLATNSPASGAKASTFAYDGKGRLRVRGEYQGDGSGWVLQSATAYVFDGMRVIEERDGNNWPQVGYTRGTDLSGTLEGAGGIGGLLARSYDYSNCDNTITYYLTNNSGYCITNLAICDDYNTYVSGATVADGDTGVFSFPGVPGANYYVFGDSCDYYFIQVYSDSFTGTLDTHLVNFTVDGDPQASETGYALCDSGSSEWLTHNYYHADGGGNITALESSVETLTASYRYDPFGNILSQSGGLADVNTYRFSSKEFMPSSGLYYYGYRFYDPGLQRWINADPLGEKGFELVRRKPWAVAAGDDNRYRFVENNPVSVEDSLGLDNPGCDPPGHQIVSCLRGDPICHLRCCAQHDQCYFLFGCKASSWLWSTGPIGLLFSRCAQCNAQAGLCVANCATGGYSPPGAGNYFCGNGPSAGTFWDNWYSMPASCWEGGVQPPKPPGYP